MTRVLALDFGYVRIGVAISDPSQTIASPLATTIRGNKDPEKAANNVCIEIPSIETAFSSLESVVVGLPLYLDGKESPRSMEVRAFAHHLQSFLKIPVHLFDERFTSLQAERAMKEGLLSRKARSSRSDAVAATILLQSFLDKRKQ